MIYFPVQGIKCGYGNGRINGTGLLPFSAPQAKIFRILECQAPDFFFSSAAGENFENLLYQELGEASTSRNPTFKCGQLRTEIEGLSNIFMFSSNLT